MSEKKEKKPIRPVNALSEKKGVDKKSTTSLNSAAIYGLGHLKGTL